MQLRIFFVLLWKKGICLTGLTRIGILSLEKQIRLHTHRHIHIHTPQNIETTRGTAHSIRSISKSNTLQESKVLTTLTPMAPLESRFNFIFKKSNSRSFISCGVKRDWGAEGDPYKVLLSSFVQRFNLLFFLQNSYDDIVLTFTKLLSVAFFILLL